MPMRPVKGAVMRVWSRSNWASRTSGHGIIDGRLGGALLGDLLVGVLDGAGAGLLQRFCARTSSRFARSSRARALSS